MKRYKKLQHIVNESLAKNRDEQLLKSLKIQNERLINAKRKSTKRPFKLAMVSSCVAVVLVVSIIGGLLLFKPNNTDSKHYFADNERRVESTLSELNSYTEYIDLNNYIELKVVKYIDILYNDTLYFIVIGENPSTLEIFGLTIIVNEAYTYEESNLSYNSEYSLLNYNLLYCEEYNIDDDGIYSFVTYGKIITEKETLYINYESIGFNETSNFLPSISNLLIFS